MDGLIRNHFRRWAPSIALALALIACAARPTAAQGGWSPVAPIAPDEVSPALRNGAGTLYAPGEVLVARRVKAGAQPRWLATEGWQVAAPLEVRGVQAALPDEEIAGEVLAVPVGDEWDAIATLQADPAVVYAEPNWIVTAAVETMPEEPFTANDSLYVERQWYAQRVNASRAWQMSNAYGDYGASVRVAVIDSGVERTHPEFGGRALPVKSFVANGSLNDDCGHGTHVAGLLGAAINNGPGIAGIAPNVVIDPYRALSFSTVSQRCTGTVAAVATAIYTAIDNNVDIINLSLTMPTLDNTLYAAIVTAHADGILLVGAAGNCDSSNPGCPVMYPAALDEVIGVAATGYANELSPYNTRGDRIEYAAPGGTTLSQLYSTWSEAAAPLCSNNYQVINNGGYCNSMGTSSAAAIATGVAALVWDMDRTLSAAEVREILRSTVVPYDSPQPNTGAGVIDAAGAMRTTLPLWLDADPDKLSFGRTPGASPSVTELRLDNPSGRAMQWQLNLLGDPEWLSFTGQSAPSISGSVVYGQPIHVSLTVSTTNLTPGLYSTHIETVGNQQIFQHIPVQLAVFEPTNRLYAPLVSRLTDPPDAGQPPFQWATPNADGRTVRNVSDSSTAVASLPFAFPLGDESFGSLRIHADGFVSLPGADQGTAEANRCLPSPRWPDQAIFGWGTDINAKADGAQVSTFRTVGGAYVIEYADVAARVNGADAYRVSFQIALEEDGEVRLNYRDAPVTPGSAPRAKVGIEALDGRLYNQLYCNDGEVELGVAPRPGQSIVIPPGGAF